MYFNNKIEEYEYLIYIIRDKIHNIEYNIEYNKELKKENINKLEILKTKCIIDLDKIANLYNIEINKKL